MRRPATLLALAALVLLVGCEREIGGSSRIDAAAPSVLPTSPSPTDDDPLGGLGPTPSSTNLTIPPLGLSLEKLLVDPDPETEGPASGTVTIGRLTDAKLLPQSDIDCLSGNHMKVAFAKDGSGQPQMTTWAFELPGTEGAQNCAEQMKRTDGSSTVDLGPTYDLPGVTVYRVDGEINGAPFVIFRALYTSGPRLFRVTVSQEKVAASAIQPAFTSLLRRQVALAPAG